MKEAPGSSVEPIFSSCARTQATYISSCCRSSMRNQRAAVGTVKVHASCPELGKGECME